jgi:hypothetical protein
VYRTWVRPSNPLRMVAVPAVMEISNRRAFDAAFRSYDELAMEAGRDLEGQRDAPPALAKGAALAPGGRARLAALGKALVARTGEPELVARLVETIEKGDDFAMARLRPYALADAWGAPRRRVLEVCLHATRVGLFDLRWDLLCPLCRGAKVSGSTLAEMERQAHCETCNIGFDATPLYLKAGMHHGTCIAVTMNDRLDYFGSVVNMAARLERLSSGEDVIISDAVRHDPEVAEFLSAPGGRLVVKPFEARVRGFQEERFHLWRVARYSPAREDGSADSG